jgi:glycerophosphoryl diester phosphodiesterase
MINTVNKNKQPMIFSHRGANTFEPENSLEAFKKAMELGCDGIEMDLRYTASGDIIVFHDRNLVRMTSQKGNVHQLSLSEIRKIALNNGSSRLIPTFQEALELIGDKVLINLDVKRERFRSNGFEEKILKTLSDFGLRDNIIISSFNPLVLKKIARISPQSHLGFIIRNRSQILMQTRMSLKSLHINYRILSKKYVKAKQAKGIKIIPWTIDEKEDMIHFNEMGVDGIITNRPEVYFQIMNQKSALLT